MFLKPSAYLFLAVMFCAPFLAFAQEPDPYAEEVTIIAPYQPSVEDANKLNFDPQFESPQIEKPVMSYGIQSFEIPTTYTPGSLSPASITGEPINKLYRNFIKAGIGNYWTPLLELYAGSLRHKKNVFSVGVQHLSSNGAIKDYGPSQYSHNGITLNASRIQKKHTLSAFLGYQRDVFHNYGFAPDDYSFTIDKDSLKQRYQTVSTGFMIKNNASKKQKGDYYLGVNYDLWNSRYDLTEHRMNLLSGYRYSFDLSKSLDREEAGIDINTSWYNERYDTVSNIAIVGVYPYVVLGLKEYELKIGARMHQLVASDPVFYFSPDLELTINVIPDAMKIFAGVTGGIEQNSLASLSAKNPFIAPTARPSLSTTSYKAFGGVNGKIGSNMDLIIKVDAGAVDNMPFFVNVPWNYDTITMTDNAFDMVYDDVTYFHVHSSFGYRFSDVLNGRLYGDYQVYSMTGLDHPFHIPELTAGLDLNYNYKNKIRAHVNVLFCGEQYSASYDSSTDILTTKGYEIDPYLDLSLGAKYRFSDPLTFFLDANNLLNNHYEYRYGFPSQGINIMLGATYAF